MLRLSIATVMLAATFLTVFMNGHPMALAQEGTPAGEEACPTTTPEENKAIVDQYHEALAGGEVDLATVLAHEFVVHQPSGEDVSEPGHEDSAAFIAGRLEDYPDLERTVVLTVAEGDLVASYISLSGTHQDDDEVLGHPATGMPAEWVVAGFFRIECGKIDEHWVLVDQLGRLMDMGVITAEELQSVEAVATPAP